MIKSMTGFGKGEAGQKRAKMKAEVRSVNHKFLEITAKLPEGLLDLEDRIREVISRFVKRGKVNLNLIHEDGLDSADKIVVDEKIAMAYYKMLQALKKKIPLEGSIRLDQLIALPGVVKYEPKAVLPLDIWRLVEKALIEACENLNRARIKEGNALHVDLKKRVGLMKKAMAVIKDRSKVNVKMYKNRLKDSIKDLSGPSARPFDKGRLEQEVALYAKDSDVTEEIIRIKAHLDNLKDCLEKDSEVGKKLDFIAQELNREINTIGSKASDFKISHRAIQLKSEVDKLREQAKNIE